MEGIKSFINKVHNRKIFILGYCQRALMIRRLIESMGFIFSGYVEIAGINYNKEEVLSLNELEGDGVLIVAVRRNILNETIPFILNNRITDIYFPTLDDIFLLESYNTHFEDDKMEIVYPGRYDAKYTASVILSMLNDIFPFRSIIDFGCGSGAYLAAAKEINKDIEIHGLDGCKLDRSEFISNDLVDIVDFSHYEYSVYDKKYDLAISIEVAEHIMPDSANKFISNLCRASDVVLFSAAIPYQKGDGHVNCQWPSYWKRLFEKEEYEPFDFIRRAIWNDKKCQLHCRQNCLVFVRTGSRYYECFENKHSEVVDVIHPDMLDSILSDY